MNTIEKENEIKKSIGRELQMMKERGALFFLVCIAIVAVSVGIFILIVNGILNRNMKNYKVISSVERQDTNTEKYLSAQENLLKYSKDGISKIDGITGKIIWTASYDMNNPQTAVCGSYVAVADIGGKEAYIYSGADTGKQISVDYEISQICVSNQGLVALMMSDKTSDIIKIYNPYDVSSSLLAEIPTNVEDGYPICMAFSPDGKSVVVSYLCVMNGKTESRVAFYNFSEVGKNSDYLTGSKIYEDIVISDIQFLTSNQVLLMGNDGFYVWTNMKKPSLKFKIAVKKEINSFFYNEKTIGLVLKNEGKKTPYQMQVYNNNGKCYTDVGIDCKYNTVSLEKKEILFYGDQECAVYRLNGVERFRKTIDEGVSYFFSAGKRNRYYLLNSSEIQWIKLVSD